MRKNLARAAALSRNALNISSAREVSSLIGMLREFTGLLRSHFLKSLRLIKPYAWASGARVCRVQGPSNRSGETASAITRLIIASDEAAGELEAGGLS